jgi:peptidoglycan L-alanyl-D-glutamate endopeptidase CwlK
VSLDAISEERLALVHPVLAVRIFNLADALVASGFIIQVTQGIRTIAEQNAIYAKGRTTPGRIVTYAQGTQSNHVMGIAVDVAPFLDGIPDWNPSHPDWQRIVALASSYSLRDGISWRDEPHLELAECPTEPTLQMQQAYLDGGVQAVWQLISLS